MPQSFLLDCSERLERLTKYWFLFVLIYFSDFTGDKQETSHNLGA